MGAFESLLGTFPEGRKLPCFSLDDLNSFVQCLLFFTASAYFRREEHSLGIISNKSTISGNALFTISFYVTLPFTIVTFNIFNFS